MNAAKLLVRQAFARAASGYDTAARFQREAGRQLLAGLPFDVSPACILDAGCGTGHGLALLQARWPAAQIVALDFALGMARRVERGAVRLCADAEALPLAADTVDFYWSNLALQWCDPQRFAHEAVRVMRPGAKLAVSTLGPATFAELRAAFRGVDAYRHTLDFFDTAAITAAFTDAGFAICDLKRETSLRHHADLSALLGEVRRLGANRVTGEKRRRGLMGKTAWQGFAAAYEQQRGAAGLPLSYDTIFVYAQK